MTARKFRLTVDFYMNTSRPVDQVLVQMIDACVDDEIQNAIQGAFDETLDIETGIDLKEVPA